MSLGRKVPEFSFLLVYSLQDLFQAIQISGMVSEITGSPVIVCSVGTVWLDLELFRQFLPNIGIFA